MKYSIKVKNAESSGELNVFSPYNGHCVGAVEQVDSKGVEQAFNNAVSVFNNREQWLPAEQRKSILLNVAELMKERFDSLVNIAVAEGGKPLIDSRIELNRAIDGIYNCVECMRAERGSVIPMQLNPASMNRVAFNRYSPIGIVVAVSAFNHPLNLIVHQVGPAIAAGCPVIVKPAPETPLSAFALVDLFRDAGLPDDWCQPLLTTNVDVAQQLVTDSRVAFFSFIGSAKVGWMLRSKLAAGARCVLEHGGAAPVIVAEDADLDDTLPLLAKGGFYHAGQVCVSVQRVFVHESITHVVADRLSQMAEAMIVGDPADDRTEVGPLIREQDTDRIEQWVSEAVSEGAALLTGGKRISASLFEPTVLLNPSFDSKVSQQEIFGPVICVYEYNDIDDAIKQANAIPYAFQASVLSKNIDTALYVSDQLDAATVMINDHTAFRVDWMPFGGYKHSGYGTGGIPYTYRDMLIEKLTVVRSESI